MNKTILMGLMFLSSSVSAASAWDKIAGQSAGVKEKLCVVVRSQQEWGVLWIKHTGGKTEGRPAVDFTKEMVVAVFLGERNQGGYKVEVKLMADPLEPKTRVVVFYREVPPAGNSFNMQMLSQPFVMVKIPRKAKVDFEEDGVMSIPERQSAPQSIFSPEEKMHIQKTMDGLQSMAADVQATFK
jgi:hypothetical protein